MKLLLSILFAAAPFCFGLLRYVGTRHDPRGLWMALASFVGAAAVVAIGRARTRVPSGVGAFSAVILVVATLFAAATGYLTGAGRGAGLWMVAFVIGICWAASFVFYTLSRPQQV
jgi:hypothetical protein